MKALLLNVFIFLIGCQFCRAQFSEEADIVKDKLFFVGGSINFSLSETQNSDFMLVNNNGKKSETTSYSFNPTIGFQLKSHWTLGLEFELNHRKTKTFNDDIDIMKSSSNSIGIFSRYVVNPKNKLQVFTNPYVRRTSSKYSNNSNQQPLNNFINEQIVNNFGISIGAQYKFADWARVTTNFGGFSYFSGTRTSLNNVKSNFTTSGFNFRSSSIYFGVEFLL